MTPNKLFEYIIKAGFAVFITLLLLGIIAFLIICIVLPMFGLGVAL